jgi:hypothetical protein
MPLLKAGRAIYGAPATVLNILERDGHRQQLESIGVVIGGPCASW